MNEFLFVCLFKFRLDLKELLQTIIVFNQALYFYNRKLEL